MAGAWTERKKIFHGGSFLKLADDNMDIQNPEAQNRELSGLIVQQFLFEFGYVCLLANATLSMPT